MNPNRRCALQRMAACLPVGPLICPSVGPLVRPLAGMAVGAAAGIGWGLAPATAQAAQTAQSPEARGPQPVAWPRERPTPALTLPQWQGGEWSLAQAARQVVVLNFWASWCLPCRAEMPSLELLAQRHSADGLQVMAVNFRETDGAIRRFVDDSGLELPILRDRDGAAAKAFGVRVFPCTIVIGRNGRAAFSVAGEVDWTGSDARRWLAPVLAQA